MKLKHKIIVIFLFISLVPLLITTIVYYRFIKSSLISDMNLTLEAISQIQKHRFEATHLAYQELWDFTASRVTLQDAFRKDPRSRFERDSLKEVMINMQALIETVKDINAIVLIDKNGKVIASTDTMQSGRDLSQEEYFILGKEEKKADVFFLDENGELGVWISGPYKVNNETKGVIAIRSSANDIIEIVNDYTGLGKTGETVLGKLDRDGDPIFITPLRKDTMIALTKVPSNDKNLALDVLLTTKREEERENTDYMGDEVLTSTRYIPATEWGVVVKIDKEEALEPLKKFKYLAIAITLLAIGAITVLALYFSRSITYPILVLTRSAENIIMGKPQHEVRVKSNDEIGILARAFNSMVQKLDFINEAGVALASSLDYKAVLDQVSKLIVPGVSDWFSIDVISGDRLETLIIAHNVPNKLKLVEELRKKFPRSAYDHTGAAKVARTGVAEFYPIVSEDVLRAAAKNEEHYRLLSEIGFVSLIILPLKIKGNTVGVITMVTTRESNRAYTEADLHLAEDLARRISVTLENARLYQEAMEQNEKKDEFMGIASHELKTPLTSVKAYIQLAEKSVKEGEPSTTARYVKKAEIAIGKLEGLISELLDVSRLQAGRLQFHFTKFDLNSLVKEVISNVQSTAPTHRIIKEGESPSLVNADRDRIEQVLINLITNAVKYSPGANKVIIRVSESDKEVIVSVTDFGIGIKKESMPKIFDRYYRVETGGIKFQGLGIGLYIASEIVKRHEGRMWAESEEGKGSTFYFSLPLGQ